MLSKIRKNKKKILIFGNGGSSAIANHVTVDFVNVAKIKGELYKSYLDRITAINTNIKLCRDNLNRIEIYYGPFEENSARSELYKKLQENGIENSYEVELTKEEFDRRCNY